MDVVINTSSNECPESEESNSTLKLIDTEYGPGNDSELDDFSSFPKLILLYVEPVDSNLFC